MDVVAVRTDELAEGPTGSRRGVALLVATVLVFLALAGLAVWLGIRDHDRHELDVRDAALSTREQAVLTAARSEAVALTTLGYKSAIPDLDRILAGATGALKKRFAGERAQLPHLLSSNQSVSTGTVLSSGVVPPQSGGVLTDSTVQAVVAVDATVTSTSDPKGVVKHYRMVMTMQNINGHWLASDVAFAGVPS